MAKDPRCFCIYYVLESFKERSVVFTHAVVNVEVRITLGWERVTLSDACSLLMLSAQGIT